MVGLSSGARIRGGHTLVCNPLSLLDSLWPGTQGHEVTLHDVLSVLRIEPDGERPGEVIGGDKVVPGKATRVIHSDGLSERGRVWQRRHTGGETGGRMAR